MSASRGALRYNQNSELKSYSNSTDSQSKIAHPQKRAIMQSPHERERAARLKTAPRYSYQIQRCKMRNCKIIKCSHQLQRTSTPHHPAVQASRALYIAALIATQSSTTTRATDPNSAIVISSYRGQQDISTSSSAKTRNHARHTSAPALCPKAQALTAASWAKVPKPQAQKAGLYPHKAHKQAICTHSRLAPA